MPLIEICCPRCEHRGYVATNRLPGVLHCSGCGFARMVHEGKRTVRSHTTTAINAADHRPRQPRKPRMTARGKQVLTPRVPAVA